MITIILGLVVAIMFVAGLVAAIEYREAYQKRMDAMQLEDEFVADFMETQEILRSCTYANGQRVIEAFRNRWTEVISDDRIEYFVSTLQTSNSYRSQFTFQNSFKPFHNN